MTQRRIELLCREFHRQLQGDACKVERVVAIPRLRIPRAAAPLKPGVKIRLADSEDLARMRVASDHILSSSEAARAIGDTYVVLSLTHSLTGKTRFGHHPESSRAPQLLQLAVVLGGWGFVEELGEWTRLRAPCLFQGDRATSRWPGYHYGWYEGMVDVGSDTVGRLVRLYRQLDACPDDITSSIAVRRLLAAQGRTSTVDALIDIWVAMESLLTTNDEHTELQYRMSLRAARIDKPQDWTGFKKQFKDAYGDRSVLGHGATKGLKTAQVQRLDWVYDLLCRIILRSVANKRFPSIDALEQRMVYG